MSQKELSVIKAIEERRSIKHFTPHEMSDAELEQLISLAALAPTAYNIQHVRYIAVTNPAERALIRENAWGQAQVTEASALIVVAADVKAWEKNPERYWRHASDEVRNGTVNSLLGNYTGNEEKQRDEAIVSAGMAAATLMLAARGMGYETCPMKGFDFAKVAEIIKLPKDHVLAMMVAVGKPAEAAHTRGGQLELKEILFRNTF
jgi:nitroreductase